MKKSGVWLARRKASLCILMALCMVSLCVIIFSEGEEKKSEPDSYAVTIRHYGTDAAEMERSVVIPLEDALSEIPGVTGIQSSGENGMAKVFVRFGRGSRMSYAALREAAQRVYESLPQSAQRPQIQSSGSSRIPVWSAVVSGGDADGSRAFTIEKTVKPRLESLEGAGEALVSGAGLREIIIALDREKAAALGIVPSAVAAILAMNDALFPGGMLTQGGMETIVTVDGRYGGEAEDTLSLGRMPIPLGDGRFVALSEIAVIAEQERRPDAYSRINGKRSTGVALMAGSGADLRKLSKNINREISDPSLPFGFTVLSDRGAEEAAALRSVLGAAAQGAFMVAIISFFLTGKKAGSSGGFTNYSGLFCALSVPVVCLVSAALLSALGLPPTHLVLAGIAAGIGTAVDPVILCSERLSSCGSYDAARVSLRRLCGPLIAGSVTTVAALLPIPAMGQGEASVIAVAIAVVTMTALVVSLVLLPPLLLWNLRRREKAEKTAATGFRRGLFHSILNRIFRKANRLLALNVRFCARYPGIVVIAGLIVSAAGLAALYARGADSGGGGSGNSVYAHVEFGGGLLAEEADQLLAVFGESLAAKTGMVNVETVAKTGSGSVLAAFDPKVINADTARAYAREIPIPGAFLFFPETAKTERHWEIKIFGDDSLKCRQIAEDAALSLAASPLVKETVLNFKQGSPRLDFFPDREKMAALGVSFAAAADAIRRTVHGPVAYKRISSQGETDVRLFLGYPSQAGSKDAILKIPVSSPYAKDGYTSGLRVDSVFSAAGAYEFSSIRREDRRRTASLTVTTKVMDPRRVRSRVAALLDRVDLPAGYSVEFDPDAIRQAQALSGTFLFFLLALVFCYMVLGAVNESFTVPFAIIFAVPPSLAVPALCLAAAGFPFNSAAACAFVAVSGMTVNAAVLCTGGLEAAIVPAKSGRDLLLYRSLRRNLPALTATTATTIAGALPFLFLREGANTLVRTMALVTALGVGGSFLCAISAVPALLFLMRNKNSA